MNTCTSLFLQFPHLKNEKDNEVKKPTYELIVENNQGYCHSDASRMPPNTNCCTPPPKLPFFHKNWNVVV